MTRTDVVLELSMRILGLPADEIIELRTCMEMYREAMELEIEECFFPQPAEPTTSAYEEQAADETAIAEPESGRCNVNTDVKAEPYLKTGGGASAKEKREIFDRLAAYRKDHGLGCLPALAEASGGAVSDDDLRLMLFGGRYSLTQWRAVGAALDKLAQEAS